MKLLLTLTGMNNYGFLARKFIYGLILEFIFFRTVVIKGDDGSRYIPQCVKPWFSDKAAQQNAGLVCKKAIMSG